MTRIEIHLSYDKNGKAYNLCNRCGARYRYKGGSGFCKTECQVEWNKVRDANSRAARIHRNRKAKQLEKEKEQKFQSLSAEEKALLIENALEKKLRKQERTEMIRIVREKVKQQIKEKKENEKQYGKYKNQRRINRNR